MSPPKTKQTRFVLQQSFLDTERCKCCYPTTRDKNGLCAHINLFLILNMCCVAHNWKHFGMEIKTTQHDLLNRPSKHKGSFSLGSR